MPQRCFLFPVHLLLLHFALTTEPFVWWSLLVWCECTPSVATVTARCSCSRCDAICGLQVEDEDILKLLATGLKSKSKKKSAKKKAKAAGKAEGEAAAAPAAAET
jgi:hypothetical protein